MKIKQGDYFLLPYRGKKYDLLVRAETTMSSVSPGMWRVRNTAGNFSTVFLPSCRRCPPSRARKILDAEAMRQAKARVDKLESHAFVRQFRNVG